MVADSHQYLDAGDVFYAMNTSRKGLSTHEASRRLDVFGPNKIVEPPKPHVLLQFLSHFIHLMALVCCLSSCLQRLTQHVLPLAFVGCRCSCYGW